MQTTRKLRGREIPITHTHTSSRKRKQSSSRAPQDLGLGMDSGQEEGALQIAQKQEDAAGHEEDSTSGRPPAAPEPKTDLLQPPSSPLSTLQSAYEGLYEKYQRLKANKLEQAEKLLADQKLKTAAYSKTTEELIELLRKDNLWLRHLVEESQIQETQNRVKELEKENALLKNELLMARAKDYQTDLVKEDRLRFLRRLLQSLRQMELVEEDENSAAFVFQHQTTGLKFVLEPVGDGDISRVCGSDFEVKFRLISLGTLLHVAPEWMRESITFSISQAPVFFNRIGAVADGL